MKVHGQRSLLALTARAHQTAWDSVAAILPPQFGMTWLKEQSTCSVQEFHGTDGHQLSLDVGPKDKLASRLMS